MQALPVSPHGPSTLRIGQNGRKLRKSRWYHPFEELWPFMLIDSFCKFSKPMWLIKRIPYISCQQYMYKCIDVQLCLFFNDDYSTLVDRMLAKNYPHTRCVFSMIFGKSGLLDTRLSAVSKHILTSLTYFHKYSSIWTDFDPWFVHMRGQFYGDYWMKNV